jgi:dTDP-4-dehydrorhamnose reductase
MSASQRVLITGAQGQLGQALAASVPEGIEAILCGRQQLDLADADACREAVLQLRPDWVLNGGAYTAVDNAESEPDLAMAVNAGAPAAFAQALSETGGRLLQVSTDFVFNGTQGSPYRPEQPVAPLGVYGATKAEGERRARQALPSDRCCVLRTSWVYGPVGRNFCLTMLRLHQRKADAQEPLQVVADQIGCPTATHSLAAACWATIHHGVGGTLHWSDAGAASWYDFAVAIGELGVEHGLLQQSADVQPIGTKDYPTPAQRPSYSLLETRSSSAELGLQPIHWQKSLIQTLETIKKAQNN